MTQSAFVAITILGGVFSAAFSLVLFSPIPELAFVFYLTPLPLFLLGLGMGLRPLYGASIIATALVLLFAGPFFAIEFFIFFALGPIFLINRALLNRKKALGKVVWYSSSCLLRDFALAADIVMFLALGAYIYLTQSEGIPTLMETFLKILGASGHRQDIAPLVLKIFPFLPGLFAVSWSIMMIANGVLAQSFLVRLQQNLRPSPSFEDLELPKSFLIFLALAFLLAIIGVGSLETLGKSATLVLTFPFFLVGLGLIHRWFHKTTFALIGLILFYCALLLFLWPALFVIFVGILKPWIERSPSSN